MLIHRLLLMVPILLLLLLSNCQVGGSENVVCNNDRDCAEPKLCIQKFCRIPTEQTDAGTVDAGKADTSEVDTGEPTSTKPENRPTEEPVSEASIPEKPIQDMSIDDGPKEGSCRTGETKPCGLSVGTCQPGTQTCAEGEWKACEGGKGPGKEVCNGQDDDCNGKVDDLPEAGKACDVGKGECLVSGKLACNQDGKLACNVTPKKPGTEICDGKDNDCNGQVDESLSRKCYTGKAGTVGTAACQEGTQTCEKGTWSKACIGEVTPKVETCNGKDDDCDGQVDNGFKDLNKPCEVGQGLCKRSGKHICKSDGTGTTCDAKLGTPSAEICDGKDNDCDGATDEGCLCKAGDTKACGSDTGECKKGKQTCSSRGQWSTCQGQVKSSPEKCDGKDNDCDGRIDDGNPGGGVACRTGKSGDCAAGTLQCKAGLLECIPNNPPQNEVCDGKDNDCDSKIDNGAKCNSNKICQKGKCVCAIGQSNCSGICVDTKSSKLHCGACGNQCQGTSLCRESKCLCPHTPNWLWAKGFASTQSVSVNNVVVDSQGHLILTGWLSGTMKFGSTALTATSRSDIFVAKMNGSGKWLWANRVAGNNNSNVLAVTTDLQDNIHITGFFSGITRFGNTALTSAGYGDLFVAKMNSSGKWLWARRSGDSPNNDFGNGIAVDSQGNILLSGGFVGRAQFGSTTLSSVGDVDIFVAKLDRTGKWIWAIRAGGKQADAGRELRLDSKGHIIFTGFFYGAAKFGNTTLTSAGAGDVFVAKLDSTGKWLWAVRGGGTGGESVVRLVVDPQGNAIVVGDFYTSQSIFGSTTLKTPGNLFVAKLDGSGKWLWAQSSDGGGTYGRGLALDLQGNIWLTGAFRSRTAQFGSTTLTSKGNQEVYIAKMDNSGKWLWATSAGGTSADLGSNLAFDARGSVTVVGDLYSRSATLGTTTLSTTSSRSIFVTRLSSGSLYCAKQCINPMSDTTNCGRCGNQCPTGTTCSFGVCQCIDTNKSLCNSLCVNLQTSTSHCGACGNACRTGQVCEKGLCQCHSLDLGATPRAAIGIKDSAKLRPKFANVTLDFWMNINASQFCATDDFLLIKRAGQNYWYISIRKVSGGWIPYFQLAKPFGTRSWEKMTRTLQTPLPYSKWLHISFERVGSAIAIYVNGKTQALQSLGGNFSQGTQDPAKYSWDNTGPLVLGLNTHLWPTKGCIPGRLAGFRMNVGAPKRSNFLPRWPMPNQPQTVINLHFKAGAGNTIKDQSGYNNDGTAIPSAQWSKTCPP